MYEWNVLLSPQKDTLYSLCIDGVRLFFNILATEAEGPRKLAQQDVLLGLTGGAMWGGAMICTVMGGPYRLH
jgi:hypothetical protein